MSILDILFPKTCLSCGKEGKYICNACLDLVHRIDPACPYCEKPSIDGFTHSKCKREWGLDGLVSVWRYEGVVKKSISCLKYKYVTEIVQELCGNYIKQLKCKDVSSILPATYCLLPVPIFWYRQNFRGFNQSELIGKMVATEMGWGFNENILYRKRSVLPQAGLPVADRKKNLQDVFGINLNNSLLPMRYPLILFDDVFTTGSTLHEACKELKKYGAKSVWGMTIAR